MASANTYNHIESMTEVKSVNEGKITVIAVCDACGRPYD